jgi:hypothetical protein
MGKPIFITDPVVAAAYHVHPGQFAYVALDAEAAWLVANHHGYPLNYATTLPAAYYVHPLAPLPFVPFVPEPGGELPPAPPPPPPAPPPPPPAPAPATTIAVGAEDTVTKIDVDGDGRPDVLVVVDRPPQNP